MKPYSFLKILVSLLCAALFIVSTVEESAAGSRWQCKAVNHRGMDFFSGHHSYRDRAMDEARNMCHSYPSSHCSLSCWRVD
jgi:hypothetical protein